MIIFTIFVFKKNGTKMELYFRCIDFDIFYLNIMYSDVKIKNNLREVYHGKYT